MSLIEEGNCDRDRWSNPKLRVKGTEVSCRLLRKATVIVIVGETQSYEKDKRKHIVAC